MSDSLGIAYPVLARSLRKQSFATLPTPLTAHGYSSCHGTQQVLVKHDEQSNPIYGGNKIRKLEYILQRANERGAKRVATFGTVGSNHALATAIHAKQLGLDCTCFFAHQRATPTVTNALAAHLELGTEIVKWAGGPDRVALHRRYLQGRRTWVIPLGGTCWLGAVGFVNAGMEFAAQLESQHARAPQRIYIANGTMGSVAGLALGLALAGLTVDIQAVRVVDNRYSRRGVLTRLIAKTATMLHRLDASIPADLGKKTRVTWRDEFLGGGYAAVDDTTEDAVRAAKACFGLTLETTYTGKAMAAMLADLETSGPDSRYLFWNTYNANPLPGIQTVQPDLSELPLQFHRYFE